MLHREDEGSEGSEGSNALPGLGCALWSHHSDKLKFTTNENARRMMLINI